MLKLPRYSCDGGFQRRGGASKGLAVEKAGAERRGLANGGDDPGEAAVVVCVIWRRVEVVCEEETGAVVFCQLCHRGPEELLRFCCGLAEIGDGVQECGCVVRQCGRGAFACWLRGVDGPGAVAIEAGVKERGVRFVHDLHSVHKVGHVFSRIERGEAEDLGCDGSSGVGFNDGGDDDAVSARTAAAEGEEEVAVLAGICGNNSARC